jgi:hypothetical protein
MNEIIYLLKFQKCVYTLFYILCIYILKCNNFANYSREPWFRTAPTAIIDLLDRSHIICRNLASRKAVYVFKYIDFRWIIMTERLGNAPYREWFHWPPYVWRMTHKPHSSLARSIFVKEIRNDLGSYNVWRHLRTLWQIGPNQWSLPAEWITAMKWTLFSRSFAAHRLWLTSASL